MLIQCALCTKNLKKSETVYHPAESVSTASRHISSTYEQLFKTYCQWHISYVLATARAVVKVEVTAKIHIMATGDASGTTNSIFDLENARLRSQPRLKLMDTLEAQRSRDMFVFRFATIEPFSWDVANLIFVTLKIEGQCHGHVHLTCLFFISWQLIRFLPRNCKFNSWPWKLNVRVTPQIDPNLIK